MMEKKKKKLVTLPMPATVLFNHAFEMELFSEIRASHNILYFIILGHKLTYADFHHYHNITYQLSILVDINSK